MAPVAVIIVLLHLLYKQDSFKKWNLSTIRPYDPLDQSDSSLLILTFFHGCVSKMASSSSSESTKLLSNQDPPSLTIFVIQKT